jgi:crotonobetaine/carnitine-CoA ligase
MDSDYYQFTPTFGDQRDWVLPKVLEHQARVRSDKPYIQMATDPPWTFAETNRQVNRLAHGLMQAGIGQRDRVLVLLPNCLDYVFLWFALDKVGALPILVNAQAIGAFLERPINASKATTLIVDRSFLPRIHEIAGSLEHLVTIYVRGSDEGLPGIRGFALRHFLDLYSDTETNPDAVVTYRDVGLVVGTGGTTGPSKSVLMPFGQFHLQAETQASLVRLTDADVTLTAFPFFHLGALLQCIDPCLIQGARAVIYENFSASQWIDRVRLHGATVTHFLGVTMDYVMKQPSRPEDSDNALRVVGAIPTAHSLLPEFRRRFGVDEVAELYGSTEVGICMCTPWNTPRPAGAAGKLIRDYYEVRLVDSETDEDVPDGEIGECLVRPKLPWTSTLGYDGRPEETAETMRNLWWHTRDLLRRDSDGWYYFVDRAADALRVGGENIATYEVEEAILKHPNIVMCGVVGVPSDVEAGEQDVLAWIVLRPGDLLDPAAVIAFCESVMPRFAIPRYLRFVEELPRNEHGKMLKHTIRSSGITSDTWDRVREGAVLSRESIARER